jgi:hypothetical protein
MWAVEQPADFDFWFCSRLPWTLNKTDAGSARSVTSFPAPPAIAPACSTHGPPKDAGLVGHRAARPYAVKPAFPQSSAATRSTSRCMAVRFFWPYALTENGFVCDTTLLAVRKKSAQVARHRDTGIDLNCGSVVCYLCSMQTPPERIQTARLLLRRWTVDDACGVPEVGRLR